MILAVTDRVILVVTDRVILALTDHMILLIIQPKQLITLPHRYILDRLRHVLLRPQINRAAMPGPGLSVQTDQSSPSQSAGCICLKGIKHRFRFAHRAQHAMHMVCPNVEGAKHVFAMVTHSAHRCFYDFALSSIQDHGSMFELLEV